MKVTIYEKTCKWTRPKLGQGPFPKRMLKILKISKKFLSNLRQCFGYLLKMVTCEQKKNTGIPINTGNLSSLLLYKNTFI